MRELQPDIVCLQEVTSSAVAPYRAELKKIGLVHSVDTFALGSAPLTGPRRYGLLIATRDPAQLLPTNALPWPERLLAVRIDLDGQNVSLFTTHIPPGASNGPIKIYTLESVRDALAAAARPRILCGDFNAPQLELADGRIVTWAEVLTAQGEPRLRRLFRGEPGARWDSAERWPFDGTAELVDQFRGHHGFEVIATSWQQPRRGRVIRRRFDHLVTDQVISATAISYLNEAADAGLSDHAPLVADLAIRAAN